MWRGRKWARRILLGALAAVAAGLIVWVTLVPGLVRSIAAGELRRMGLRNVALKVRGLSLRHVQMANVAAGEGQRLRVGAIGIGFTFRGLLGGRLSVIELTGLEADVRVRDGRLDLGPLAELGGAGEGAAENTFHQIQLRSSVVLLDLEGQRLRIALHGTATDAGQGKLELDIRLEAEGCTATLAGSVNAAAGELKLGLAAQVREVAALLAALPPQWGRVPVSVTGTASFEGFFSQKDGLQTLSGRLQAPALRLAGQLGRRRFAVDSLDLDAGAISSATHHGAVPPRLWCSVVARGAGIEGLPGPAVARLAATLDGEVLQASRAGASGQGWVLSLNASTATGIRELLAGKPYPVVVDVPSLRFSCSSRQLIAAVPAIGGVAQTESNNPVTLEGAVRIRAVPTMHDGTTSWGLEVEAPELDAAWASEGLRIPGAGLDFAGVRARLRLTAQAKNGEVKAQLLPGSAVSAEGASATLGGPALALARGEPPAISISVGEETATLAARTRGRDALPTVADGAVVWSLRAPEVLVGLRRGLAKGPTGLVAKGVNAEAKLALEAGPEGGTFTLAPGFSLTIRGALLGSQAEAADLALGTDGSPAVATVPWGGADGGWSVEAPGLRLGVGQAKVALPGGVAAEGIRLATRLAFRANTREVGATIAGGSGLTVGSLELPGLGIRKAAEGPLVSLELGEQGLEARLPLGGEKPAWSLDAPELLVTQSEADLVLPKALGKVEGCRGDFAFSVNAGPKKAWLTFPRVLLASCRSLHATVGGEPLRLGPLDFRFLAAGGVGGVAVEFDGMNPASGTASFNAQVSGPVSASLGEGDSLSVPGAVVYLDAGWEAKRGAVVYASLVCGLLEARLERKLGDEVLRARLPEADVDVGLVLVMFGAQRKPPELTLQFALRKAAEAGPLAASLAGVEVVAGKAELSGKVTLGGGEPVVEANVALDKAAVRHKASGVALDGLSARVPVSWNASEPAAGTFAIERLEAAGVKLANVSGTLGVADMRAALTAGCEPLAGAKVSVDGSLDFSREQPCGLARLSLPLFELRDDRALTALVPQLAGLHATGTLGVEGHVRLASGQVQPTFTLTLLDAELKSARWDIEAGGVFATVRLSSLAPPLTPHKELQIALVRRAKLGEFQVEHGAVAFRLEPTAAKEASDGWALVVQRADWGWAGGRLYVEDFHFDPAAQEHAFTLHAADLKLEAIAALVPDGQLSGVGTLSGFLPVRIAGWPNIRFGNGHLHSLPHQRGWLRIKDLGPIESTIAAVAEASIPDFLPAHLRAEGREQLRESLLTALREFEYDELKLDFMDRGDETLVRLTTRGRGRNPDPWGLRYPIGGVEINLIGLDSELLKNILKLRVTH